MKAQAKGGLAKVIVAAVAGIVTGALFMEMTQHIESMLVTGTALVVGLAYALHKVRDIPVQGRRALQAAIVVTVVTWPALVNDGVALSVSILIAMGVFLLVLSLEALSGAYTKWAEHEIAKLKKKDTSKAAA